VIFIDAISVKIRDGQVTNRPVYVAIGVTVGGERDMSLMDCATWAAVTVSVIPPLLTVSPISFTFAAGSGAPACTSPPAPELGLLGEDVRPMVRPMTNPMTIMTAPPMTIAAIPGLLLDGG
jgi:hypothetical protein